MFRYRRQLSQKGLSLLEITIAAALLTVGVIMMMNVLLDGFRTNNTARYETVATNAAMQWMERIFQDNPSNVLSYNNTTFPVLGLPETQPGTDPGAIAVDNNSPHLVTITVSWGGRGGVPRGQVTLNALRSEVPRE